MGSSIGIDDILHLVSGSNPIHLETKFFRYIGALSGAEACVVE